MEGGDCPAEDHTHRGPRESSPPKERLEWQRKREADVFELELQARATNMREIIAAFRMVKQFSKVWTEIALLMVC